jgi:DNA modification methylase
VRVICSDCLDPIVGMPSVPSRSVHAIVTDPPYCSGGATEAGRANAPGQGLRSETLRGGRFAWFAADNMTTQGLVWLMRECAVQWSRMLVDGGSAIVFCDWRMFPILAPAMESSGLRYQNLIVWDKGSMGLGRGFRMRHELAIHLTNGVGSYYAADVGNVIQGKRVREGDREHATQKPVDVLSEIVRTVAPEGGMVADPFAGSGSVGVACKAIGRDFIGWELSAENVAIAERRINGEPREVQGQVDLFGGAA